MIGLEDEAKEENKVEEVKEIYIAYPKMQELKVDDFA